MKKKVSLFFIVFLIFVSICWAQKEDKKDNDILATYGENEVFSLQDFKNGAPKLASWFGTGHLEIDYVYPYLEDMILEKLMAKEAVKARLEVQPQEDLSDNKEETLALTYLRSRIPKEKLSVKESEAGVYYEEHKDRFINTPPKVRFSHILVKSEDEAKTLLKAIKRGEAFDRLAKEKSLDPYSAPNGGKMGLVIANKLIPPLAESVLSYTPGKADNIVKTAFGYHIVEVIEKYPAQYKIYDKVKKVIHEEMASKKQESLVNELKSEMWKKYNVMINKENLQAIVQGSSEKSTPVTKQNQKNNLYKTLSPKLALLSQYYDLGSLPSRKSLTFKTLIMNSGKKDLIINKVLANCKYIQTAIKPENLVPGQIGELIITYNPELYSENCDFKEIFIKSNDPDNSKIIVQIKATKALGEKK